MRCSAASSSVGRIAPVAGGDRDDMAAPCPQVLGAGIGIGEHPDAPSVKDVAVSAAASSGIIVDALATALMARHVGERRIRAG